MYMLPLMLRSIVGAACEAGWARWYWFKKGFQYKSVIPRSRKYDIGHFVEAASDGEREQQQE
jgi:hypothetical protein